jgi:hypothetical protein
MANGIDYGWKDEFISKPLPGAVVRDWTNKTLVVDLVNGIGEEFHFEVPPDTSIEKAHTMKTQNTNASDPDKVGVIMHFPLPTP